MKTSESHEPSCPVPFSAYERVTLAHGGGGRVMHRLIEGLFRRAFASPELDLAHDGARVALDGPLVLTTDAFTVSPRFFPGGDIGSLAVHGTVNDLAVSGARPRYLTASFVLEEGLPLAELARLVESMAAAARASGVRVVAGDTKVVERGKGDGVFITTTGAGEAIGEVGPWRVRPGDVVIVSGPVGDHGTAVMLAREGLEVPDGLVSDAQDVSPATCALFGAGLDVRCLRDATRGGVATVLAEIAQAAGVGVRVEGTIPVRPEVDDACELLGLDPLYVACEGRFVAFVGAADAERALEVLRGVDVSREAARVGAVVDGEGSVVLVHPYGSERVLDVLSGEQLPRIC
ncbi:MAG: hydrogenase expression/formation protein HypE [Sandaracinaceae bacterium]|nr:hydrogenase expression/formation protein HypE [Sandaracinaceae bacterium]